LSARIARSREQADDAEGSGGGNRASALLLRRDKPSRSVADDDADDAEAINSPLSPHGDGQKEKTRGEGEKVLPLGSFYGLRMGRQSDDDASERRDGGR
jgi:hypothetical protein